MGDHIRISADGTHLFFNLEGDTIRFQAMADLGEAWAVYEKHNMYIQGEVISVEEVSILDTITDLVKTISFHVMDAALNPLPHFLNNITLKFSENYGMVEALNFIIFPLGNEIYFNLGFGSYTLTGMEGIEGGAQNLTWKDVYDYQPGDELHIRNQHGKWN